ncbi:MAG TPA: hypothetical protein VMG40_08365 [Bryobacteraceae bacterium]|nr:hypothetical protein [Bryobacteraceae bacterium]
MRPYSFVLCLGLAAIAAAGPNFSGEWKMNPAKSDFGGMPAPDVITRSIQHDDPALDIKTYQKGAAGEVNSELKYTTDGKPATNKVRGMDATGTARWEGDTLVIESWLSLQGTEIKSKEVWELSDGGKTLTIRNHVSIPQQGEFDTRLVLEKQ